ncbi:2-dehydropantoate 2-reductase [Corynebacterium halotolerans]|uniref:2-dehydropantoate 2-reductase n=1 Tax=Corynebacterium halotolerans YIM 70093 = DSM 44683 TaxID=1121362 RepID=M1NL19_9CORY|nr:2-dehydropantoate 2-reductase [Corynebacterium halotolerans]AGF72088.1 2-dehydropantoate 2-reductase [Corynebacterium halotolerans YIM 70093 = DSM 44683]
MRIAFIGAGAVGGWFGGRLAAAGHDVVFVARGATLDALITEGLRLNDEPPLKVTAVGSLAEVGDCDVVFLTVKATGGTNVGELLSGAPGHALVAVTQNAVEVPTRVAEVVGRGRTLPGVVRGFFHHTGPGRVEFHGGPISYTFGTFDGRADATVDELAAALNEAGIEATVHPDIWAEVWEKAMFVTCFGGLGAWTGRPLGHLRTVERTRLEALMREVHAVARADGVPLADHAVARTMAFADRMPAEATSSMQRDLAAGDPGELDAQVGAVCRIGAAHGVDTPLHSGLLRALG